MALVNCSLRIERGNVQCRILGGPVPAQLLDRELNPHLGRVANGGADRTAVSLAQVFDPLRGTFLAGALPRVRRLLREAGYRCTVVDVRTSAPADGRWSLRGFELRDYQREVVEEAMRRRGGMVGCGTGAGKTLLAAACIARAGLPAVVLTYTRSLLRQTCARLREYLGVEPGVIGDGAHRPARLTVALAQSLSRPEKDLEPWRRGTLVIDEGHHAAAATSLAVIREVDPAFLLLLSAVPFRAGVDQALLDGLTGGTLTGARYSGRYLVAHGWAVPPEVRFERNAVRSATTEKPYADVYREQVVESGPRNTRVAAIARREIEDGRPTLVLVDQVRHGELLARAVPGAVFLSGETPKRALASGLAGFAAGAVPCVIATSALLCEGTDIAGIETLVMAGGQRSRAKIIQSCGRGMRRPPLDGAGRPRRKRFAYHDFYDADGGVLERHSRQRIGVLLEQGFHVPPPPQPEDEDGPPPAGDDPIPPTWAHVAGTRAFVLVDAEGAVLDRSECLRPALVPARLCRKGCRGPVGPECHQRRVTKEREGDGATWLEDLLA